MRALVGSVLSRGIFAFVDVCEAFDLVVQKVPGTKHLRDFLLDTVLGPKEEFEESRTRPIANP